MRIRWGLRDVVLLVSSFHCLEPTSVGITTGLVIRSSGTSSVVSNTKNASPVSPTFMLNGAIWGAGRLFGSRSVTLFSPARSTWSLPNLTWNGELERVTSPSEPTFRMTMTSIAPERVAGLIPESTGSTTILVPGPKEGLTIIVGLGKILHIGSGDRKASARDKVLDYQTVRPRAAISWDVIYTVV